MGTNAAKEGHGPRVIAALLDHTDTQNAGVYVETSIEFIQHLDRAMAFQLAPLAQAFRGSIVESESSARCYEDPGNRVTGPNILGNDAGPRTFPIADKRTELKFADALCVFPLNFTRSEWATSRCGIQSLTINQLNQQLGSSLKHGKSSVFSRLGINLPDGSPVVLTTNDFRHFLNTIAQGSGLTQFDIAKWSGRVNEQQNAAYDHVPALVLLSECNELLGLQRRSGELTAVERRVPVSMRDFHQLGFKTAHSTDSGFCVHDFVMLPCQLQLDCDNCDEHVCIKGDQIKTARIRQRLSLSRELLRKAEVGVADGRRGADRWLKHHRATVERLEKLVEILDDPSIPVGAIIRLSRTHGASLIDSAATATLGPLNAPNAENPTARQVLARVDQLQLAGSSQ